MNKYRKLTSEEIETLKHQCCSSDDWSKIEVAENFNPLRIRRTIMTGNIKLGVFEKRYTLDGNVPRYSGITDAVLHNCTIGNNVYIGKIGDYIANYNIGDDSY